MRVLGLISGWDGGGFDIAMKNIRVRSTLTGTVSVYGEDGRKGKLAAASRRTALRATISLTPIAAAMASCEGNTSSEA